MVSFIQILIFAHELTSLLDIKVVMSKKDNTEQAILQAAETEFLDKGFALAKTTEIAKQAGVTHAMLHYYYRTKEKLFERVFQEKVDLMAHSLVATLDDGKPFLKQMEDLTGAHFDFIAKNPKLPFFLLNEIHLNEKRRELYLPVLSSAVRNTLQNVERRLEQAVKRGEVRPIRTADLMFSIFSLNVMSFVGQSLVQQAFDLDREDVRQFILQRRAENIEMILSRLRK